MSAYREGPPDFFESFDADKHPVVGAAISLVTVVVMIPVWIFVIFMGLCIGFIGLAFVYSLFNTMFATLSGGI